MKLFTIGFTKTSAENFFSRLRDSGAVRVIDVRLNNVSQLAGFAKKDDLQYFVKALCGMDYAHLPELAPTAELLEKYKKRGGSWPDYERDFLDLMAARRIESTLDRELMAGGCLLCSEAKPHHCHRRLVAEYLQEAWGGLDVSHL